MDFIIQATSSSIALFITFVLTFSFILRLPGIRNAYNFLKKDHCVLLVILIDLIATYFSFKIIKQSTVSLLISALFGILVHVYYHIKLITLGRSKRKQ